MDPFIGEIKLVPYNFAPKNWAFCQGQLMSIAQNTALFSLLGTMYGGDGRVTFGLPDLRGRAIISQGQGPGLPSYSPGDINGVESVTLTQLEMPSHGHPMNVTDTLSNQHDPQMQNLAQAGANVDTVYENTAGGTMPTDTIGISGGDQPHENRQPYLTLNYCIALQGIFPQRS